jgi:hypothetical protein
MKTNPHFPAFEFRAPQELLNEITKVCRELRMDRNEFIRIAIADNLATIKKKGLQKKLLEENNENEED